MLKQKSVIPPLNISEINKRGVFLNSMRLNSLLNYSNIKEFPIWWSGFYIDNSRLNNPINSFTTKRERTKKLMLQASRKIHGYTCLDVTQLFNPADPTTPGDIGNLTFNNRHAIAVTSHDSFISFDKNLDTHGHCSRSTQILTYRPTQRATQRATQRDTQRATQRGQHSPTQRDTQRGQHSPTQRATLNKRQSNIAKNINTKKSFSQTFTELALQSSPKNIGLFVNCSPIQFSNKIFYNEEFDIIRNYYEEKAIPVKIFIFNIKNNKCYAIKEKIQQIINNLQYNNLENNELKKKFISNINLILKSLEDKNCYEVIKIVNEIKQQLDLIQSDFQKNDLYKSEVFFEKDPVKDNKISLFNKLLETLFNKLLKSKNCFFIIEKFKKKITGLKQNKIITSKLDKTLTEIKKKQDQLTELQKSLNEYFNENDYTCFEIYNMLKKIIDILNKDLPVNIDDIRSRFKDIKENLENENNKSCFEIQKLLTERIEKDKLQTGKNYITFECVTCSTLADCSTIINQKIKHKK